MIRLLAIATALFVLHLGAATAQTASDPAERRMTDQAISDAVTDELAFDQAVPAYALEVKTSDGIVVLDGRVTNILAKERATRIASTVRGVRGVVNEIEVAPAPRRSDAEIRRDVIEGLTVDPATEVDEIDVRVKDGVATLSGDVQSWQEEQLAIKVAKSIRGVTDVVDEIDINYQVVRPDDEIRFEVEQALRWNVVVDDDLIEVEVEDGVVSLSGTAASLAEKTEATATAWVSGVRSVDDSALRVERWAREPALRNEKFIPKPDEDVADAVRDAMLYDARVDVTDVTVEVDDGVVTLRGAVDELRAKRAAAETARNTVGAVKVVNRIKVQPHNPTADDAAIADALRAALARNPIIERYDVKVTVYSGIAYLNGVVDDYYEKAEAEQVAAAVPGVVSVDNNLVVSDLAEPYAYDPYVNDWYSYDYDWYRRDRDYTYATDSEIRQAILDQFWWSPFVDAEQIRVTVDNGVVTLTGRVDSWYERDIARENAFQGGATWVINRIEVAPQA